MFNTLSRIFRTVIFVLLIVTAGSAIVLGILYINSRNELITLKASQSDTKKIIDSVEESKVEKFLEFKDIGSQIEITYPESWYVEIDTDFSTDFDYSVSGKVVSTYDINVRKEGTILSFSTILSPIDGAVVGISNELHDSISLGENIIRYREKDTEVWTYGRSVDCVAASGELFGDLTGFDLCAENIFPEFGNNLPAFISIHSSNEEDLTVADKIFLSAI